MSSLQITGLSFSYAPGKQVIDNLSVTIKKNEKWAVIGKNGSGKSTLIRCLARLETVRRGVIALEGRDLLDYSSRELARICAYVPQATLRIPPNFTVLEYVLMGRYPYCGFPVRYQPDDRKIAAEALELTDTTPFADRSMKTLSGGELQRVFIAGAVAQRTGMMLLDEPVSFLDPMHQEMIHATLDRVHREYGTTLVTVTHDINAALQRSTHVLALVAGMAAFTGTTERFRDDAPGQLKAVYGIGFEMICGGADDVSWIRLLPLFIVTNFLNSQKNDPFDFFSGYQKTELLGFAFDGNIRIGRYLQMALTCFKGILYSLPYCTTIAVYSPSATTGLLRMYALNDIASPETLYLRQILAQNFPRLTVRR